MKGMTHQAEILQAFWKKDGSVNACLFWIAQEFKAQQVEVKDDTKFILLLPMSNFLAEAKLKLELQFL